MSRSARPWRGAGLLLGGALFTGVRAVGAEEPPISNQLSDLAGKGRCRVLIERPRPSSRRPSSSIRIMAPPRTGCWRCKIKRSPSRRLRQPIRPLPAAGRDTKATLERTQAAENITRQELTDNVEQRIRSAQALMNQNQPEAALSALRLALNVIRSATDVSEDVRSKLERRVQSQLMRATVQAEADRRRRRAGPPRLCRRAAHPDDRPSPA